MRNWTTNAVNSSSTSDQDIQLISIYAGKNVDIFGWTVSYPKSDFATSPYKATVGT